MASRYPYVGWMIGRVTMAKYLDDVSQGEPAALRPADAAAARGWAVDPKGRKLAVGFVLFWQGAFESVRVDVVPPPLARSNRAKGEPDAYQQNWEACGRIGAENLRKNLEKALTCAKKRSSVRMIFELCALFLFTIT